MIFLLLPVQLHDDRKHKQVIPAPTGPTTPRTLSKQIYYGSTRRDSFSVKLGLALCPSSSTMAAQDVILLLLSVQLHDGREHKQVMPATPPTRPRTLLPEQFYYGSTRRDSPSASYPIA